MFIISNENERIVVNPAYANNNALPPQIPQPLAEACLNPNIDMILRTIRILISNWGDFALADCSWGLKRASTFFAAA